MCSLLFFTVLHIKRFIIIIIITPVFVFKKNLALFFFPTLNELKASKIFFFIYVCVCVWVLSDFHFILSHLSSHSKSLMFQLRV